VGAPPNQPSLHYFRCDGWPAVGAPVGVAHDLLLPTLLELRLAGQPPASPSFVPFR
jgi:hypothetical protein